MALLLACETTHQFQEAAYQAVRHYTSCKGAQTTPVFALRAHHRLPRNWFEATPNTEEALPQIDTPCNLTVQLKLLI
jgi:hypothetical protein